MRTLPPHLANDPAAQDLLFEVAAAQRDLSELRNLASEKELALRQAQERVNDYERDWVYTTARNFRGTIARWKQFKSKSRNAARTTAKLTAFILALASAPLRIALRLVGIGRRPLIEKDASQVRLKVGLTEPLPTAIVAGQGNSFIVGGWTFHPDRRVTHLELRLVTARTVPQPGECVDAHLESAPLTEELPAGRHVEFADRLVPVIIRNVPNRQVLTDHHPELDPNGNSYWSGFYAMVVLPPVPRAERAQLAVRAHLDDGTVEMAPLGKFTIQPQMPAPRPLDCLPGGTDALVAVCMATYNPPEALFRRQIESIQHQTHGRWVCLIRDDGSRPDALMMMRRVLASDRRFVLRQNPKNFGFYKNFEAVLADVPAEIDFVALCDQDDYWHPDKLETLLRHFAPGTSLVYSDMNIADETGHIKETTYWTTRDNNYTNFATLLLANTVTGAASLFRRSLLEYLLPFPEKCGDAYHDHWLGCTAMALGEVRYIDRPLYDYVQHGHNVIGHVAPKPGSWLGSLYRFFAFFLPYRLSRNIRAFFRHGRGYYFADLLRIQHTARNVLIRCAREITPARHAVLNQVLRMADSWTGRLWLALRPLKKRHSWRLTVGVEQHLLQSLCWRTQLRIRAWWGTRMTARGILRGRIGRQALPRPAVINHIDTIAAIERITAPLTLAINDDSPARLNVVVSVIDFKYVFGGYITVFHLCRTLARRGHRLRIIVVDECDYRPVAWADNFRSFPGLEDFLDRIELIYAFDRKTVVPVSPRDTMLATSWWTAHVARHAAQALGKERFVYLIQEYEPGFYAYGALAAIAHESYGFPHYALFSTEILRDYFREHGVGVYAGHEGDRLSEWFANTITGVGVVTPQELRKRRRRRVLFYCRPEPHALRNMFDLGVLALRRAVAQGAFAGWEFHGIGTLSVKGKIQLADGVFLELLPRLDQEAYRKILKNYDIGLSLMCSPHPSLVPLEMAGAGMLTVTNTWANKTAQRLTDISTNFVPVEATVPGVTAGLLTARAGIAHFDNRARGAAVNWPTQWDQSFHPELMQRLDQFIEAAMADQDVDEKPMVLRAA